MILKPYVVYTYKPKKCGRKAKCGCWDHHKRRSFYTLEKANRFCDRLEQKKIEFTLYKGKGFKNQLRNTAHLLPF